MSELLEKLRYQDSAEVSMVLKNLIFEQLQKKSEFAKDLKVFARNYVLVAVTEFLKMQNARIALRKNKVKQRRRALR